VIDYLRRTPTLLRLLQSLARSIVGAAVRILIASLAVAYSAPDGMTDGEKFIAVWVLVAAIYAWDIHDEVTKRRDAK
jgi:hypothetical protein